MAVKVGSVIVDVKADTAKLVKGMNRAQKSVQSTVRTMKNLLAGLAVASTFKNLITAGLNYNSSLEVTQQSIAGLLIATSKLEDAQGNAITQQQLYNTAMGESATILQELQRINEQTPMGLNETAQIYKTMLPSMRAVGATQEELIELTKNLSVASGIAGLKTQQLLAGVDGLATGTVLANSELGRFLNALGLTNAQLKNSSNVVELLNSKLGKLKGEITMTQQLSTLKEAWTSTLGVMTKSLWSASKDWIDALIDYINRFKEGVKLLPIFFQAMGKAISDIWRITMAQLRVWYEEFVDTVKVSFDYLTSLGVINVGFNMDLESAKADLAQITSEFKTGKEHMIALLNAQEKSATVTRTIGSSLETVTKETEKAKAATVKLKEATKEVAKEQDKMYENIQGTLTNGITNMYRSWMDGATDWKDMMGNILKDILAQMLEILVIKQLVSGISGAFGGGMSSSLSTSIGMFAKGGAFSNGVQMFASGGVVDSPTAFGMSGGMGIMGENGSEAILPLTRTSSGNLGVEATTAPVTVNVNNYGEDKVEVNQSGDQINIIISKIASDITRGVGSIGQSLESRYSLRKT